MPLARKDLLKLLTDYHREKQLAPLREAQKTLAVTLDGLNVFGALDDVRRVRFSPHLSSGPAARDGLNPQAWVGVMIWHRPTGYLGYKTLTLLGVWARLTEEGQQIITGAKRLAFAAPFYDPGAYFVLIRKVFDLYYNDDGSPPAVPSMSFIYDAAKRLEQREIVSKALAGLA